jgi:hypothetical protein
MEFLRPDGVFRVLRTDDTGKSLEGEVRLHEQGHPGRRPLVIGRPRILDVAGCEPGRGAQGRVLRTRSCKHLRWEAPMATYLEWVLETARSVEQIDRLGDYTIF